MFALAKLKAIAAYAGVVLTVTTLAFGGGFISATRIYDNRARVAALQGEIDRLNDDNMRRRNAESTARAAALMLEQERNKDKDQYNALLLELEGRADLSGCGLSRSDAQRLLNVR